MKMRFGKPGILSCFAGLVLAGGAHAQGYPERPITLVVPVAAGGGTDASARVIAEGLGQELGRPVLVENRPGAFGVVGAQAVADASPDGYRLLYAYSGILTVNQHVFTTLSYDPEALVPIGMVSDYPFVMAAHPSVPADNLEEFIAYVKAHPGQLNYASAGVGGTSHIAMELLNQATGMDIQHIAYSGGAPAMSDMLSGGVSVMFNNAIGILPHLETGALRTYGISSIAPSDVAPGIPPIASQGIEGLEDFDLTAWFALFAPPGTSDEIVQKVGTALQKVLARPDVQDRVLASGSQVNPLGPDELRALIATESARMERLVDAAGISAQQ